MDKNLIADTLKKVKETSPKRNFKQSIDIIINLKGLDLKKAEHQINTFVTLHHDTGRKVSVCAFVAPDMESKAKEICNEVILSDQFVKFKGKADVKKLANKHDFFIAQATIMPKVATTFGRFLGPKGKMPNPKTGSVFPPNANLKQICDKLGKTVSLVTKNEPTIKCMVGKEDTPDEGLIDNALTVYNAVVQKLPNEKQNVKSVVLKLTMGPAFIVGKETEQDEKKDKKDAKKTKEKPKEEKEVKTEEPKPKAKEEEPKKTKSEDKEKTKKK